MLTKQQIEQELKEYLDTLEGRYGASIDIEDNYAAIFITSEPGSEVPSLGKTISQLSQLLEMETPVAESVLEPAKGTYSYEVVDLKGAVP